jgi:hypothetical protein
VEELTGFKEQKQHPLRGKWADERGSMCIPRF